MRCGNFRMVEKSQRCVATEVCGSVEQPGHAETGMAHSGENLRLFLRLERDAVRAVKGRGDEANSLGGDSCKHAGGHKGVEFTFCSGHSRRASCEGGARDASEDSPVDSDVGRAWGLPCSTIAPMVAPATAPTGPATTAPTTATAAAWATRSTGGVPILQPFFSRFLSFSSASMRRGKSRQEWHQLKTARRLEPTTQPECRG